jgi:hypothetical protein
MDKQIEHEPVNLHKVLGRGYRRDNIDQISCRASIRQDDRLGGAGLGASSGLASGLQLSVIDFIFAH